MLAKNLSPRPADTVFSQKNPEIEVTTQSELLLLGTIRANQYRLPIGLDWPAPIPGGAVVVFYGGDVGF